jgi:hypothetical protein
MYWTYSEGFFLLAGEKALEIGMPFFQGGTAACGLGEGDGHSAVISLG